MIKNIELKYENKLDLNSILKLIPNANFKEVKNKNCLLWCNKLFFCENLIALKYLLHLKKEGKLINSDGSNGVKLVYIDPPFATKKIFKNNIGVTAYDDKLIGVNFIEFLRKRILLLKELLTDDGSIYIHLDYRMSHYIKIILDEIFGKDSFRNEIIWKYNWASTVKKYFANKHDIIFWYTKSEKKWIFNIDDVRIPYTKEQLKNYKVDDKGYYCLDSSKKKWYAHKIGQTPSDVFDISIIGRSAKERKEVNYPTQKPEQLLERLILASSNKNDIVLDCFAGSGTTGIVAEKLNRNWIMCDSGDLSINIIKNRLKNLKRDIGNTGEKINPKAYQFYQL